MTLGEFADRLETFGADLARWPAADAEAARRLIAASAPAQDLFAKATADDMALFGDEADTGDLAERVMSQIAAAGREEP
jgi:hypothetical protein